MGDAEADGEELLVSCDSRHMEVSGRGPEPMKAKVFASVERYGARAESSNLVRSS